MDYPVPRALQESLIVPKKSLFGAGPSNYAERIQKALCKPNLGHLHPETLKIMDDIKEGLKYLFQTVNPLTFCLSASGHGGMEACFANLVVDGDVVLVASSGLWGDRAADMARRHGGDVRILKGTPGFIITLEQVREYMEIHKPAIFFLTHGESSTGVLQPLEGFGDLCRSYNCLFMVDTVITLGAVPVNVDKMKIDVAYSGSQKALNSPAGITPITFGKRALHKIQTRTSKIRVYYFDANLIGQYWNCFPGQPRIYHHTISAVLLYGLREGIAISCEEGLDSLIVRHSEMSRRFENGIKAMKMEMFVQREVDRVPTVNAVKIPEGVDAVKAAKFAMERYSVEFGLGLGPTVGNIFRVGLMGVNSTPEKVDFILNIMKESLEFAKIVPKM